MFWLKACSRCNGDLHEVHDVGDRYISCIQCGRILTAEQEKALPMSAPRPLLRWSRPATAPAARRTAAAVPARRPLPATTAA